VVDINDNAPVIELAAGGLQLYESAELNTELHVGTARDLDSQRHGIDSFRLGRHTPEVDSAVDVTSFFYLVVRRRLDDVRAVDLYVRLVSTLDREINGDFLVSMRMSVPHYIRYSVAWSISMKSPIVRHAWFPTIPLPFFRSVAIPLPLQVGTEMLETSFRIYRDEETRTLIGCPPTAERQK